MREHIRKTPNWIHSFGFPLKSVYQNAQDRRVHMYDMYISDSKYAHVIHTSYQIWKAHIPPVEI